MASLWRYERAVVSRTRIALRALEEISQNNVKHLCIVSREITANTMSEHSLRAEQWREPFYVVTWR
jgi:hypothetical protein